MNSKYPTVFVATVLKSRSPIGVFYSKDEAEKELAIYKENDTKKGTNTNILEYKIFETILI